METMSISEFKTHCLAVLERVRTTGRPLVVTKRGRPIARITPPPADESTAAFGSMRTTIEVNGDLLEPVDVGWDAVS